MKTLGAIRRILAQYIAALSEQRRRRAGAGHLRVRRPGEATPLSDVDILVALERPLGWEIVDLRDYLEALLELPVHLLTAGALRRKPHLWQAVREDLVHV
jgi:predicted nucleotidyltransferase